MYAALTVKTPTETHYAHKVEILPNGQAIVMLDNPDNEGSRAEPMGEVKYMNTPLTITANW
jgi:hypothetical protein